MTTRHISDPDNFADSPLAAVKNEDSLKSAKNGGDLFAQDPNQVCNAAVHLKSNQLIFLFKITI